ncbi:hypothetical protein TcG_04730, partial [Trypanosoma cruzi]
PSRTVSAPTQHCSATAGFFFCARGREISRISGSRSRQQLRTRRELLMRFAQKQSISRVTTRPLRATAVCTGLVRALQTRGRGTSVRPREGPTARTHFTAQGASKKVHSVSEIITQQQRRQKRSGGKEEERAQYMALIISGTTRRHHRGRAQRTGTSDCPVEHEPALRLSTARNTGCNDVRSTIHLCNILYFYYL